MPTVGSRLDKRLLIREIEGSYLGPSSRQGIYGSRSFVKNLDIVNELYAHSGCVNALTWSQSGNLLASGSDDTHVNIHQRSSSESTFSHTHSISTGHTQNIFSVKFMPHSEDRTLISCAGDGEVRVFDVNYTASSIDSTNSSFAHSIRQTSRLSYGETHTRVYRAHRDRVKRIITENSPHLFLTCSEDGDVRQFDIRAPSDPSRTRLGRFSRDDDDYRDGPRPLISYRKSPLDLNTISVATSQPHYLALGGSHLYCFLHDRRMLRQRDNEPICVKRFAPREDEPWADRGSRGGHITACKISDYCPNELIVSWSAGGIGGFDIHKSPDALEAEPKKESSIVEGVGSRVKKDSSGMVKSSASGPGQRKLKRKRNAASRTSSMGSVEKAWRESVSPRRSRPSDEDAQIGNLEKTAFKIACSFVEARRILYGIKTPALATEVVNSHPETVLDPFTKCLDMMDDYITSHDTKELVVPSSSTPASQSSTAVLETTVPDNEQSLRRRRREARRYVQAMGTLTKVLVEPPEESLSGRTALLFDSIDLVNSGMSSWAYDYLAVLVEYLKYGVAGVERYWNVTTHDSLAEKLKTLLEPASGDEDELIDSIDPDFPGFLTEKAATRSLMTHILAQEPGSTSVPWETKRRWGWVHARSILMKAGEGIDYSYMESSFGGLSDQQLEVEDRIEKALLSPNNESERSVRQTIMDVVREDEESESSEFRSDSDEGMVDNEPLIVMDEDDIEEEIEVGDEPAIEFESSSEEAGGLDTVEAARTSAILDSILNMSNTGDEDEDEDGSEDEDYDDEMDEDDDDEDDDDDDDDDDDENDDDETNATLDDPEERRRERLRNTIRIKKVTRYNRNKLQSHAPLEENIRLYRGHCNVQTVKDVNFYGLQDEYVVSGSDCGHVFIWDKETTEPVQILHGDSSVVNVVQGHPTEPMLAVSGIDDTIKIFSPDRQLQDLARKGIGMYNSQPLAGRQRFKDRETIMGDNEIARQNGLSDAVITSSMIAQLARSLHRRQMANGPGGAVVNLDQLDNCTIM
ncbi:hypothetical protein EYR41_001238 [Orbilia oligospora]|uniref:Uncharacterized protein n=1 Tax=Orbilia oligospora TaxID=2813651 RepID=A0A7C8PUY4_ORBOL|nr:WD and tetratricopeptide repeats [Orbilia oligospora]TGJ74205.1 hypothetical protein EYR41_001238 [Orbilia oligospora]